MTPRIGEVWSQIEYEDLKDAYGKTAPPEYNVVIVLDVGRERVKFCSYTDFKYNYGVMDTPIGSWQYLYRRLA